MAQSLSKNSAFASDKISLSSPFVTAFNWLIALGENSNRGRAISALSEVSDEELAAQGTTRRDEAIRILGGASYL